MGGVFVRDHVAAIADRFATAVVHLHDHFDGAGAASGVRARRAQPWPVIEAVPDRLLPSPFGSMVALSSALKVLGGRGLGPDLIHAHVWSAGLVAALWGRAHRVPVVITEHSSTLLPEDPAHLTARALTAAKLAYRMADARVAVGGDLADRVRGLAGHRDVQVIPNPIDPEVFGLGPGGPAIATVGALIDLKRVDRVLRAFAATQRSAPRQLAHIVGDGPRRRELERLAQHLGIADAVRWHGSVSKGAVAEILRNSDLVVSASSVETFGVTLAEALMCGTPVVATASGGPGDIVTPDDGRLVPVDDDLALAQAIRDLGHPLDLEQRRTIRGRALERFSFDAVGAEVGEVYERVLRRRDVGRPSKGADRR